MTPRFDRPMPFVEHVGARVLTCADGASQLELDVAPVHANTHGVAHGGVLFTLADTGMGAALYSVLHDGEWCSTVELKINYFRPVTQGRLACRSQVVHRGRSLASLESTLTVGDQVVAKASGTFAIRRSRAEPAR